MASPLEVLIQIDMYVHEYVYIHTITLATLAGELKERQEAPMAPRRAVVL